MIMSYFINHFVILQRAYEKVFHVRKYHPEIILICGIMGALFLTINTATIDTGIMNTPLHVFCAGNFFAFTLVANFYNGVLSVILYRKERIGSFGNTVMKVLMIIALVIQIYISIYGGSGIQHTLEFTLAFTVLANFFILAKDVSGYELVYDVATK